MQIVAANTTFDNDDIIITPSHASKHHSVKLDSPYCAIDISQLRHIERRLGSQLLQNAHVPISLTQLEQLSQLARSNTISFFDGNLRLDTLEEM